MDAMPMGARRSDCPISFALVLFGDRWTLRVVRDLAFEGKDSFTEFLASDDRIARNIRADRLASLKARGSWTNGRTPPTDAGRSTRRPNAASA